MLFIVLWAGLACVSAQNPLQPLFSWKQLDWNFPNDTMRKSYETSGRFVPANNLPLGVNIWNDKLFITVPRWKKGVPANLNFINLNETIAKGDKSPKLSPYPSWEDNDVEADNAIVNILRMRIDACDRMWAIDSGVDDIWGEFKTVQRPKLIVIDLKTNKIIHRYTFKDSDLTPNSFFADSVVDVDPQNCSDAYVYNSDLGGYGLVVYSLAKNDSWRIQNNYFYFDPLNGDYDINGIQFQWTDGLFGLTLSPPMANGSKTLYFHAMSSTTEFSVSTDLIKDQESLTKREHYKQFQVVGNKGKNSQGTSMVLDPATNIIYFTQLNKNALACWDTHMDLNPNTFRKCIHLFWTFSPFFITFNQDDPTFVYVCSPEVGTFADVVAQDNQTMVFPNDLALDLTTRKLYLMTDDLASFQYSEFDWNRTNFYVHVASLDDLTKECRDKNTTQTAGDRM